MGAVAAGAATAPLPAQVSVRLGGVRTQFAGAAAVSAGQAGLRLDWAGGPARGALDGSWAQFQGGGWAAQFSGDAAWTRPLGRGYAAGLVTTLAGNVLEGGAWTGQAQGGFALGHQTGVMSAGIGVTGGGLRATDSSTSPVVALRLYYGVRIGPANAVLRTAETRFGSRRFDDIEVSAAIRSGVLSTEMALGLRRFRGFAAKATWRAQAAVQLARAIGLEAAAGVSPRSPEGFAHGRYVSGGLRLSAVGRAPVRPLVERIDAGRVRVRLTMPGAAEVSIAGDWNAWTPARLSRDAEGRWTAELPLGAGAHKFVLMVGERTVVPRGVPRLPDGFGGEVGLLVVD